VNELDFIRRHAPHTTEPTEEARAQARRGVLSHIEASTLAPASRPSRRVPSALRARWRLAAALGAAVVIVAVALVLTNELGGERIASAAGVLRQAAITAAQQPQPAPAAAGQYLYMKSVEAYLSFYPQEGGFAVLVPGTREVWLGEHGRLHQTSSGEPVFLSQRDHDRWVAAGSSRLEGDPLPMDADLGSFSTLDLPTDPDVLFDRLKVEAADGGDGLYEEMFVLVGDHLRETLTSSSLRAALYEVAARIPGVKLEGELTDSAGRPGLAVSLADKTNHTRHTLVFDPKTSRLLAEQDVVLDSGYELGYPAGTVIGYATYLVSATVSNNTDRPTSN
jgi:hypothetical protein